MRKETLQTAFIPSLDLSLEVRKEHNDCVMSSGSPPGPESELEIISARTLHDGALRCCRSYPDWTSTCVSETMYVSSFAIKLTSRECEKWSSESRVVPWASGPTSFLELPSFLTILLRFDKFRFPERLPPGSCKISGAAADWLVLLILCKSGRVFGAESLLAANALRGATLISNLHQAKIHVRSYVPSTNALSLSDLAPCLSLMFVI